MRADRIRSILSLILLVCLLLGLIIFAALTLLRPKKVSHWNQTTPYRLKTMPKIKHEKDDHDFTLHTPQDNVTDDSTLSTTKDNFTDDSTLNTPQDNVKEEKDSKSKYRILLNLGPHNTSGIVYVQYEDRLGFVCSDGFTDNDANVVCRELGHEKGIHYHLLRHYTYKRYTDHVPILSRLNCTGNERRISDCNGYDIDKNATSCTWFATVVCFNEDKPYELRLINSQIKHHGDHSGLVEMKMGGVWGVVCAIRTFDDELADILCRNMNYTGGITMERGMLGPITRDKLWIPYISCAYGESVKKSLFDCSLILHTENILHDKVEHRNNRYNYEYMACLDTPNSFAAAVHCLNLD